MPVEGDLGRVAALGLVGDPGREAERGLVTDVLAVQAGQVGHPVAVVASAEAGDGAFHELLAVLVEHGHDDQGVTGRASSTPSMVRSTLSLKKATSPLIRGHSTTGSGYDQATSVCSSPPSAP